MHIVPAGYWTSRQVLLTSFYIMLHHAISYINNFMPSNYVHYCYIVPLLHPYHRLYRVMQWVPSQTVSLCLSHILPHIKIITYVILHTSSLLFVGDACCKPLSRSLKKSSASLILESQDDAVFNNGLWPDEEREINVLSITLFIKFCLVRNKKINYDGKYLDSYWTSGTI